MGQLGIDEIIGDKRAVMSKSGEIESFTVFEQEKPISILQQLSCSIVVKERQTNIIGQDFGFSFVNMKKENASCVFHMVTRPDKGHLGLSDEVMYESLMQQKEQGRALTYYNPENMQEMVRYQQFGFAPVGDNYLFIRKKIILSDEILTSCILEDCVKIPGTEYVMKKIETSEIPELVQFVNSELSIRYGVFAFRTVSYFERILEILAEFHGYLFVLKRQDKIAGYFSLEDVFENEICREALFIRDEIRDDFFETRKDTLPVLARVVSLRNMVKHVCCEGRVTIALRIEDPMIRDNNGTYLWFIDEKGSRLELVTTENSSLPGPELSVTIGEFTSILLGYKSMQKYKKFESMKLLGPAWLPERK